MKLIDLTGQKFGRLLVIKLESSTSKTRWLCKCDCGNERIVHGTSLKKGTTVSCGCYGKERRTALHTIHGKRSVPEYAIWNGIKNRCLNPNLRSYPNYGGRGITICDRWRDDFQAFYEDMGPRPSPDHSVDRIDTNGPYSPENCKWSTRVEQARNRRPRSKTGYSGVYKLKNRWIVRIGIAGMLINLGSYKTIEEAVKARKEAEKQYWGIEQNA